jgi:hypothetical protein
LLNFSIHEEFEPGSDSPTPKNAVSYTAKKYTFWVLLETSWKTLFLTKPEFRQMVKLTMMNIESSIAVGKKMPQYSVDDSVG